MRMRLAAVVWVGLVLAGCGAPAMKVDPTLSGPYPFNYKAIMAEQVRDTYFDPHTLRDVAISAPDAGYMGSTEGWWVCVRANGKNRMGAYAGMQTTGYLIRNGVVVDSLTGSSDCAYEKFEPWPEMENTDSRSR